MGPDGGDGGRGGHLILQGDPAIRDLALHRRSGGARAPDGNGGGKGNRSGSKGADLSMGLPLGTRIESSGGDLLSDILRPDDNWILRGGGGGKGNARFATSRNRSPMKATLGKLGESSSVVLRLLIPCDTLLLSSAREGSALHERLTGRSHPSDEPALPSQGVRVHPVRGHERILLLPPLGGGRGPGMTHLHHAARAGRVVWAGAPPVPALKDPLKAAIASGTPLFHWGSGGWEGAVPLDPDGEWPVI